jgi:tRNA dimethylallyltransferase
LTLNKKYLISIVGPTAVGKTALAIQVAKHFNTEIISADSRQFYAEMSIGTAKPSEEELHEVKHHFIGNVSIQQLYSAGDFERDALKKLDELFTKYDIVVMVGGSGLYIKAVCEGLHEMPKADEALRNELQHFFDTQGIEPLQERLRSLDIEKYNSIDIQNTQRVMRAIEIAEQAKHGFQSLVTPQKTERPFTILTLGLNLPRELLYDRINKRVDHMLAAGLVEEVKSLQPYKHLNALQTVGYKELFEYAEGIHSFERAIDLIKQHTRNFAKRQLTWFRRDTNIHWIEPDQKEEAINWIEQAMLEN